MSLHHENSRPLFFSLLSNCRYGKNEQALSFTNMSCLKRIFFLYKPSKADIFVGAGGGGGDLSLTYMINIEVEKVFGMW